MKRFLTALIHLLMRNLNQSSRFAPHIRISFAIFLFIFFIGIDKGVSQEPIVHLSPQEQAWLEAHPRIRLGFNPDMEPWVIENGLAVSKEYGENVPEIIHTDPEKLRQILANLLANAVKNTESGRIELSVHTDMDDDTNPDSLIIRVTGTGIGIAPEHIEHIFQPFYQTSEQTQPADGAGPHLDGCPYAGHERPGSHPPYS